MKGTDCTPEQIEAASTFVADRGWQRDAAEATLDRDDAVRLLAWYGALRYVAGRDGTGGTLEQPGVLVVVEKEVRSMNTNHEGGTEGQTEKPADQGATEGAGQTEGKPAETKPAPDGD